MEMNDGFGQICGLRLEILQKVCVWVMDLLWMVAQDVLVGVRVIMETNKCYFICDITFFYKVCRSMGNYFLKKCSHLKIRCMHNMKIRDSRDKFCWSLKVYMNAVYFNFKTI
jgi:hypothetical protein